MAGTRRRNPAPIDTRNVEIEVHDAHLSAKKLEKQIVLPKFSSKTYRNWVHQVKSTLDHFNVWDIIQGIEDPPVGNPAPLANYNAREKQAYNALVNAMETQDITLIRDANHIQGNMGPSQSSLRRSGSSQADRGFETWHAFAHLM